MNSTLKIKRVTPGYKIYIAMFPELNFWPDETLVIEDKKDQRTLDKAVAQRERKKTRNMIQGFRGGFIEVAPNLRFPEFSSSRAEHRRFKNGKP